jgi:hypothetical protein
MNGGYPLDILVGQALMVPGGGLYHPQGAVWPSPGGEPGLVPAGMIPPAQAVPPGLVPGNAGCPPAYNPCTPTPFQQRCYEQAMRSAVAAKTPQIPLGFRSTIAIPAGATSTVITLPPITPDVPMCMTHFEVPRTVGAGFLITSLTTSRINLLASGTGVSAEGFAPDAINRPPIMNPLVMPGQQITLIVENIGADSFFFATLWGIPGNMQPFCI